MRGRISRFHVSGKLDTARPVALGDLLLGLGVLAIFEPLSSGFSKVYLGSGSRRHFVLVGSGRPQKERRFAVTRRLCRLCVRGGPAPRGYGPKYTDGSPVRRYTSVFTSSLLVPRNNVYRLVPRVRLGAGGVSVTAILGLRRCFSISHSTLLCELRGVKLVARDAHSRLTRVGMGCSTGYFKCSATLCRPTGRKLIVNSFNRGTHGLFRRRGVSRNRCVRLLRGVGVGKARRGRSDAQY